MIITKLEGTLLTKAHGVSGDYVIVPDLEGWRPLEAKEAALLCDRHAGIGADGAIRIVAVREQPGAAELAAGHLEAEWYLDFFDAEGNSCPAPEDAVRVAAHYLAVQGIVLVPPDACFELVHAGGVAAVRWDRPGYSIDMGEGMGETGEAVLLFEASVIGLPGYAFDSELAAS